jgi:hypothetical protein
MDREDDLVKVHLDLPNHWWFKGESLWAKALGDDLYEIQNVPFCAYGLNCGDVVRALSEGPEFKPEVREVVRRSGNRTLRISFHELSKTQQSPLLDTLEALGTWVERANDSFVCLNVPPATDIATVVAALDEQERSGTLEYETCEARVPGSFDDAPEVSQDDIPTVLSDGGSGPAPG